MEKKSTLQCSKCHVTLTDTTVTFSYLGRSFHCQTPRCPRCGQVYLPETFISGKLSAVETKMEDDYRTLNS